DGTPHRGLGARQLGSRRRGWRDPRLGGVPHLVGGGTVLLPAACAARTRCDDAPHHRPPARAHRGGSSGRPASRRRPSVTTPARGARSRSTDSRLVLPRIRDPMAATQIAKPFHRPGWVYEEKVDGWRVLAYKDAAGVRLVSRNAKDLTRRFPELASAVAGLKPATLLL